MFDSFPFFLIYWGQVIGVKFIFRKRIQSSYHFVIFTCLFSAEWAPSQYYCTIHYYYLLLQRKSERHFAQKNIALDSSAGFVIMFKTKQQRRSVWLFQIIRNSCILSSHGKLFDYLWIVLYHNKTHWSFLSIFVCMI